MKLAVDRETKSKQVRALATRVRRLIYYLHLVAENATLAEQHRDAFVDMANDVLEDVVRRPAEINDLFTSFGSGEISRKVLVESILWKLKALCRSNHELIRLNCGGRSFMVEVDGLVNVFGVYKKGRFLCLLCNHAATGGAAWYTAKRLLKKHLIQVITEKVSEVLGHL
jgi:hypothetical protein